MAKDKRNLAFRDGDCRKLSAIPVRQFSGEFAADVIVGLLASVGTELESTTYDVVPIVFCETVEIVTTNAVFYEAVKDACIEIVASTDSAHGDYRLDGITLSKRTTTKIYTL